MDGHRVRAGHDVIQVYTLDAIGFGAHETTSKQQGKRPTIADLHAVRVRPHLHPAKRWPGLFRQRQFIA